MRAKTCIATSANTTAFISKRNRLHRMMQPVAFLSVKGQACWTGKMYLNLTVC